MQIRDLTNFEELTVPEASKVVGGSANKNAGCPIPDPPPRPPRPIVPSRPIIPPRLYTS